MNLLDLREPVSTWTHAAGLVLALPATLLLWRRGAGDVARRLSLLVYGLSLALCYGASALYHGLRLDEGRLELFGALDHVGIYTLIAGTYTPIAAALLDGRWRRWTLRLTWLAAAAGAILRCWCRDLPIYVSTSLYLAMGWGALFCFVEMARTISYRTLRPILAGGLIYSVGAVLNLLQWPTLWPGVFGAHELFHLFVLAGSLTHFAFILRVVAPAASATSVRSPLFRTRPEPFPARPHLIVDRRAPRAALIEVAPD